MKMTYEQMRARWRRQQNSYLQPKCLCGNVLCWERAVYGPARCRKCLPDDLVGCKINEQEKVMIDWTKPIELTDGRPARYMGKLDRKRNPHMIVIPGSPRDTDNGFDEAVRGVDANGVQTIPYRVYTRPGYAAIRVRNVPPKPRRGFITIPMGIPTWGTLYNHDSDFIPPGFEKIEVVEVRSNGFEPEPEPLDGAIRELLDGSRQIYARSRSKWFNL